DIFHRLVGRLRRSKALVYIMLYGLDDDDGIIHHNTDGQYETEHGQHVDREAKEREKYEGTDNGNWDGKNRDKRCSPALKKDKHHQGNQNNGLNQGSYHRPDR